MPLFSDDDDDAFADIIIYAGFHIERLTIDIADYAIIAVRHY